LPVEQLLVEQLTEEPPKFRIWKQSKREKSMSEKYTLENHGFEELDISEGMTDAAAYTSDCSGSRSDCCTRTCSADANFVATDEDWAKFLDIKGGKIQY
jgi:hypothetical protein